MIYSVIEMCPHANKAKYLFLKNCNMQYYKVAMVGIFIQSDREREIYVYPLLKAKSFMGRRSLQTSKHLFTYSGEVVLNKVAKKGRNRFFRAQISKNTILLSKISTFVQQTQAPPISQNSTYCHRSVHTVQQEGHNLLLRAFLPSYYTVAVSIKKF